MCCSCSMVLLTRVGGIQVWKSNHKMQHNTKHVGFETGEGSHALQVKRFNFPHGSVVVDHCLGTRCLDGMFLRVRLCNCSHCLDDLPDGHTKQRQASLANEELNEMPPEEKTFVDVVLCRSHTQRLRKEDWPTHKKKFEALPSSSSDGYVRCRFDGQRCLCLRHVLKGGQTPTLLSTNARSLD